MTDDPSPMRRQSDTRPVPDPTEKTTLDLHREILGLRELLEAKIRAGNEMTSVKFKGHDDQFQLIESQRVEQKQDATTALNAALASAKEAVREQNIASGLAINKSETSTKEQLNQLTATFNAAIQGVTNELSGVKERVGKIENIKVGANETIIDRRQSQNDLRGWMVAAIGFASLAVAVAVAIGTRAP